MKKVVIILVFSLLSIAGFSQETNAYAFFVNVVNDNFKYPLVGFVNVAKGNHKGLQAGFVNWNAHNFTGLQIGYVNAIGNNLDGVQCGFINTTLQQVQGAQVGFVNTTMKEFNGIQVGFVNTAKLDVQGVQVGFVNTALQTAFGPQVGFVNTTVKDFRGLQIGYVNVAMKEFQGTQVGFVNVANKIEKGFQFGFVNYADTIGEGIPIGFLSFIRRGGYKAIEYSFSEFFPVTIGFKTGVEKFYTSLYIAYKPSSGTAKNTYASGFGFGSIIPFNKSFFFNPELISMSTIEKEDFDGWNDYERWDTKKWNSRQLTSFVPNFGVNLNKCLSITAGPSVTWSSSFGESELLKPAFNIANFEIDSKNSIFVGARVNLRCRF